MYKNKFFSAILIAIFSLVVCYSVSAQSRAVSNPAAATKSAKSNKSKSTKRTKKMVKKGKGKSKVDDEVVRNGDTNILPMRYYGESESMTDLARRNLPPVSKENGKIQEYDPKEVLNDQPEPNAVTENVPPAPNQTETLAPLAANRGTNFDGPGSGLAGFSVTSAPPDTTMAVGPNHIVAWVNTQYVIFNKSGTKLLGPLNGNTLFTGMGNVCETTNRGDPILQYDRLADRWFLSQFAFSTNAANQVVAPYLQCIAVSTTNNPTGTYYRYTISFGSTSPDGFNDYGKLGVWTDAYYTSYNIFGGSPAGANTGVALCASDRTKMLAGDATATTLCAPTNFYGGGSSFLPADLDGTELPTNTTQGGIFARFSTAPALRLIKLKPNFAASTVTLTDGFGGATGTFINIPTGAITRACNGAAGTCIAQPGTTNKLDTLGDRLMYRLAYRNRAGTDSLVVAFSVDPDGAGAQNSAARWFEIRNPFSATPTLFQNSTYNPGASGDRWMGSIAMDKFGNMLMGYSVANAASLLKPSIGIAGRLVGDPVNTLQSEIIDTTGTGSQTGTLTRWGDYSTMQIDPADDTTFWFTTEYLSADGTFNWRTRITSYKLPVTGVEADVAPRPNGDGAVQSNDVVQVRRFLNGTDTFDTSTNEFQRADSSPFSSKGDGQIASDDVVQARRYVNASAPPQPAGGPTAPGGQPARAVAAVKSKTAGRASGLNTVNTHQRQLRVESATASAGAMVTVNIRVDSMGNEAEYGFILNYDSTRLTNPVVRAGTAGASVRSCNTATAGRVNCSVGGFPNNNPTSSDSGIGEIAAADNQILITVTFTVAANAPTGTPPLTLTNVNASSDLPALLPITSMDGTVTITGPTAATASVSGRVKTATGVGIDGVTVSLFNTQSGETVTVTTGLGGVYVFEGIAVGSDYIIAPTILGYSFSPSSRYVTLSEEVTAVDFVATRNRRGRRQ